MAQTIPTLQPLEFDDTNQEQAWTEWIEHIEDAFLAFDITEDTKLLALLRFYGESLHKNQAKQHSYVTRLRTQGAKCNFAQYSLDKAIIDQLTEKCISNQMRRAYLKESELTVQKALQLAYTYEATEAQASQMEKHKIEGTNIHKVTTKYKQKQKNTWEKDRRQQEEVKTHKQTKKYFGCNGSDHLHGQTNCPAFGKKCNHCGIMNHFATACMKKRNTLKGRVYNLREDTSSDDDEHVRHVLSKHATNLDNDYVFRVNTDSSLEELVLVDDIPIKMLIDSGATVNLLDGNTFDWLTKKHPNIILKQTKMEPKAYGDTPIPLRGEFFTTLTNGTTRIAHNILVTQSRQWGNILGKRASTELGFLMVQQAKKVSVKGITSSTREILDHNLPFLEGLGRMKDFQLKLTIDDSIQPVAQPPQRVTFHFRKAVEQKIQDMLDKDLIERVEGPTPWVSPLVTAPKPNGDIRICADLRIANKAVKRTHHPIPTVEQLLSEVNGARKFSKVDLNSYYHQIELAPESRDITTFSCDSGIYRYKVLVMGITSAAEEGQRILQQILQKCPNCRNGADDILIWGKDTEEHNKALKSVLQTLKDSNLSIAQHKSVFHVNEVEFHGFMVSEKGIKPTDKKIKTIRNFVRPETVQEIRSFLGLINYLTRFIPQLATLSEPLKRLTRADTEWRWTEEEEECFKKLKDAVIHTISLTHFDPQLQTTLIVDASPVGLGAILCQNHQGILKPISYASRTLTNVERRYCQLEKEALAIVWACEKFHLYLYGK
ncbi:hypothetical protein Pmani_001375 [Petrolisthes manimaculis]|uniref:Reverse transcriptase/retrotransposon-derived protein RNase H-like domain-containing protein n=1 Tax=Petrolisthes manimaculis TaxID=1843537 RepID=A0AAE1QNA8_9EUCA|nr:hypothetical protein Pmani_001375 [Petrolisthes manimaculis]